MMRTKWSTAFSLFSQPPSGGVKVHEEDTGYARIGGGTWQAEDK